MTQVLNPLLVKKSIIEALKLKDINNLDNKNLITIGSSDKIVKFSNFTNG